MSYLCSNGIRHRGQRIRKPIRRRLIRNRMRGGQKHGPLMAQTARSIKRILDWHQATAAALCRFNNAARKAQAWREEMAELAINSAELQQKRNKLERFSRFSRSSEDIYRELREINEALAYWHDRYCRLNFDYTLFQAAQPRMVRRLVRLLVLDAPVPFFQPDFWLLDRLSSLERERIVPWENDHLIVWYLRNQAMRFPTREDVIGTITQQVY